MTMLLNAALIRDRRLELGLSSRKLAAITGLGQAVVRGLEAGTNHKDLTFGDLHRLADTLAVEPGELLAPSSPAPEPVAGPPRHGEHLDQHVAQIGALLFEVDRLIPVESVATTTGLTLDQTHEVLDELDRRLRRLGLLLHRLGNAVKIWRTIDAVSRNTLQTTWRTHLARRGLDIGQVQLLHQAHRGRRHKTLTNDQQVTAAQLVNAGILDRTNAGGVELSADVRYSLLLDCQDGDPR